MDRYINSFVTHVSFYLALAAFLGHSPLGPFWVSLPSPSLTNTLQEPSHRKKIFLQWHKDPALCCSTSVGKLRMAPVQYLIACSFAEDCVPPYLCCCGSSPFLIVLAARYLPYFILLEYHMYYSLDVMLWVMPQQANHTKGLGMSFIYIMLLRAKILALCSIVIPCLIPSIPLYL